MSKFSRPTRRAAYVFGLLAAAVGCQVEQLDPAYVHVPAVDVETEPQQGAAVSGITDVRVVLGSESLGFYPLPATIPVLPGASRRLLVEPVVKVSGQSSSRTVYPLLEALAVEPTLRANTVDTLRPTLRYVEEAEFLLVDDGAGVRTRLAEDLDGDAGSSLRVSPDPFGSARTVIAGELTATNPVIEVASEALLPDRQPQAMWLELDYRGEVPITVGLISGQIGTPASRVPRYAQGALAREDWTRIYFQLGGPFDEDLLGGPLRVALLAVRSEDAAGPQRFAVDNLRLVYR